MPVDLSTFPADLATQLGVSTFAGQVLASTIFLALLLIPTMFLAKKNYFPVISVFIVSFLGLGCCIAFGWLSPWFLLVVAMLTALMFAGKMREWISG